MKEFDRYFSEKLNEEVQFPNREKNWMEMSRRLDALETGAGLMKSRLGPWKAVSALAVLFAGIFAWQNHRLQSECDNMKEQIAGLQTSVAGISRIADSIEDLKNTQEKTLLAVAQHAEAESRHTHPATYYYPPAALAISQTPVPVMQEPEENTAKPVPVGIPETNNFDHLAKIRSGNIRSDAKEHIEAFPALPQPVPGRATYRYRIGLSAVAGKVMPEVTGISMIRGQGVTAEYKLWRNYWVGATAEWLTYDLNAPSYPGTLKQPEGDTIPGPIWGWGWSWHHYRLIGVESTQQTRQYSLGVRYEIPTRWLLKPSVRLSYSWIRAEPSTVTYTYFKRNHYPYSDPTEYFAVVKTNPGVLGEQWRLGFGLERDMPRWSFGLMAEYSRKSQIASTGLGAIFLKGGISYKL
ncbi:MAG: hypothetical protein ACKOZV_17330 [Bacteroidota bacterium]